MRQLCVFIPKIPLTLTDPILHIKVGTEQDDLLSSGVQDTGTVAHTESCKPQNNTMRWVLSLSSSYRLKGLRLGRQESQDWPQDHLVGKGLLLTPMKPARSSTPLSSRNGGRGSCSTQKYQFLRLQGALGAREKQHNFLVN